MWAYFQAEYTRDMEEHSHVAGDSSQPAGPRVGTLHAIPPTMVRTLDIENFMTVDVLYNGHLGNRGKWPLWGVVQYFHLKKLLIVAQQLIIIGDHHHQMDFTVSD